MGEALLVFGGKVLGNPGFGRPEKAFVLEQDE